MLRNEILRLTAQNDITTQPLDPASSQIHSGFHLSTEGRELSDSIAEVIKNFSEPDFHQRSWKE
jgi:hypothetical protein